MRHVSSDSRGLPLSAGVQFGSEYICATPFEVVARDGNDWAVRPADGGRVSIIETSSLQLLSHMSHFKTAEEHIADYRRTGLEQFHDVSKIKERVGSLKDAGLIRSAAIFGEPQVDRRDPLKISTIAVVTKNRPLSLARCVESICRNVSASDREIDVRVYDDSDKASTDSLPAKGQSRCPILHSSRQRREWFIRQIIKASDVSADVIRFALQDPHSCGSSFGANLNALLIDTRGKLVLSIDDDVVCRVGHLPVQSTHLRLTSQFDPATIRLFPTQQDACEAVKWSSMDICSVHEELLGRTIADCVKSTPFSVREASLATRAYDAPGEATVAPTMTGVVGSSGMGAAPWSFMSGPVQRQLLASEESYKSLRGSDNIVRSTRYPTICDGQGFMTTIAGFDNRDLLPPFFPVLRNQDGVFGCLLRTCWPKRVIGHLPWVVLHDPLAIYRSGPAIGREPIPRLSDLVMDVTRRCSFDPCGEYWDSRLSRISDELIYLGKVKFPAFRSWIQAEGRRFAAHQLLWLRRLLRTGTSSVKTWQEEMQHAISKADEILACTEPAIADLAYLGTDTALARAQTLFFEFGRLLCDWPKIVDTCSFLASKGVHLSEQIA